MSSDTRDKQIYPCATLNRELEKSACLSLGCEGNTVSRRLEMTRIKSLCWMEGVKKGCMYDEKSLGLT